MAKFSPYNISLKKLSQGTHTFSYDLDDVFFHNIDSDEIKKGNVQVELTIKKTSTTNWFHFHLKGTVQIPCDRCLDYMNQEIDTQNKLIVKIGKEYLEESDEIITIPEEESQINIAWFLYEFIVLDIPIKHVHPLGKCNRQMAEKLYKHKAISKNEMDDDSETPFDDSGDEWNEQETKIDPRWEALKGLNLEENEI